MSETPIYNLEKSKWTEQDFKTMGWHDAMIYAFAFITENPEGQTDLLLDIDYIFDWIHPVAPAVNYKFQVAPCTLVFHNISDLVIDISTSRLWQIDLEIDNLYFEAEEERTYWVIETHRGYIRFEATGYTQYVRQRPKYTGGSQQLTLAERGGVSFAKEECCIM